ncbi:VOC family protein [Roseateles violae]|uniref:VOC family protein n=1 Tax=Roseateles violae TaxID=3058042 RepID=A0ABT8DZW5_9BURK|nr:VOC family protein [Pelomonas sp. PFR6]MDN3923130.1 VOC family protein [Pelomonas sp. PFR6]
MQQPLVSPRGIDHLALRVRDLEASIAFYCGLLGCRIEARNEAAGLVHLRAGGQMLDLVWREGRMGRTDRSSATAPGAEAAAPNLHHFCLVCAPFDPAALSARLDEAKIERSARPQTNLGAEGDGSSMYVLDPDGHLVELKFYPPSAAA